jgi:hypothetical protein
LVKSQRVWSISLMFASLHLLLWDVCCI